MRLRLNISIYKKLENISKTICELMSGFATHTYRYDAIRASS